MFIQTKYRSGIAKSLGLKLGSMGNLLMDRFALSAPAPVVHLTGRWLFWPIAVSQYAMFRLGLFDWYSEIYRKPGDKGGRILLGAMPWPESTRTKLLKDEHVSAVINMISEKSVPFHGVDKRLDIPLPDFMHPQYADIQPALTFIDESIAADRTVYLHCRAGKGRSATVAMCWLVSRMNMTPSEAQEYLLQKRPQVLKTLYTRDVVKQFSQIHPS